jgi:ribosomal protein S18 acetylase RimI-like enzyme
MFAATLGGISYFWNMKIVQADFNDIPQLVELVNSAYRGDSSRQGWTTEADFLEGIRVNENSLGKMMEASGSYVFKCVENNRLVGCVYMSEHNESLYLGMLTVSPLLQGKGIGKSLLHFADEFAREKKFQAIEMTVISIRKELIDWYKSKGYVDTGIKKPFPMDDPEFGLPKIPLEFIVLKKTISK